IWASQATARRPRPAHRRLPRRPSNLDQAGRERLGDRLGSVDDVETAHGLVAVEIDGALAQAEDDGNLGRGLAPSDPGQDLLLALREVILAPCARDAVATAQPVPDDEAEHLEI